MAGSTKILDRSARERFWHKTRTFSKVGRERLMTRIFLSPRRQIPPRKVPFVPPQFKPQLVNNLFQLGEKFGIAHSPYQPGLGACLLQRRDHPSGPRDPQSGAPRPPRRTARVRLRGSRSRRGATHSRLRFRRFTATAYE